MSYHLCQTSTIFQPIHSLRSVTICGWLYAHFCEFQPIHSLRSVTKNDFAGDIRAGISTHTLLAECNRTVCQVLFSLSLFQPIHSLRSVTINMLTYMVQTVFQPIHSLRSVTAKLHNTIILIWEMLVLCENLSSRTTSNHNLYLFSLRNFGRYAGANLPGFCCELAVRTDFFLPLI